MLPLSENKLSNHAIAFLLFTTQDTDSKMTPSKHTLRVSLSLLIAVALLLAVAVQAKRCHHADSRESGKSNRRKNSHHGGRLKFEAAAVWKSAPEDWDKLQISRDGPTTFGKMDDGDNGNGNAFEVLKGDPQFRIISHIVENDEDFKKILEGQGWVSEVERARN